MAHTCDKRCRIILEEHASGQPCPPAWNSLTHLEQAEFAAAHVQELPVQAPAAFGVTSQPVLPTRGSRLHRLLDLLRRK
jgi:hypothetical protein